VEEITNGTFFLKGKWNEFFGNGQAFFSFLEFGGVARRYHGMAQDKINYIGID